MKQYLDLLEKIMSQGIEKESGRANMPNTIGISHAVIQHDMKLGFPLLTTKKMYWKGIVHELLWFLRGETNIKYLVDNNVHIWDQDAYRWFLKYFGESASLSFEEFISHVKEDSILATRFSNYDLGDLGKVYGYQWRNQNGVDQIAELITGLQQNPYSRYHIIDAWNKADFPEMALPPCHLLYQFISRPLSLEQRGRKYFENIPQAVFEDSVKLSHQDLDDLLVPRFYLDLNMYQRSCDTFLGVPFNIASMALLDTIVASTCNMLPGVITWIGGDTHLYVTHLDQVAEQLTRTPRQLPTLLIKRHLSCLTDIEHLTIADFDLLNYSSEPAIKAELSTGLKKA
ncbi:MAG: thymidylate synthase [Bacteroidales bacterium]